MTAMANLPAGLNPTVYAAAFRAAAADPSLPTPSGPNYPTGDRRG